MYHQYHRVVERQTGPLITQEMYYQQKGQCYCHSEASPVLLALELLQFLVKKGRYKSREGKKSAQIATGMEVYLTRTDQCCSISLAKE